MMELHQQPETMQKPQNYKGKRDPGSKEAAGRRYPKPSSSSSDGGDFHQNRRNYNGDFQQNRRTFNQNNNNGGKKSNSTQRSEKRQNNVNSRPRNVQQAPHQKKQRELQPAAQANV